MPFHALRHTFASHAFHYGMDVKLLATTIGHQSVETTLNVYAHSTEKMKREAARKIDQSIGTVLGADSIVQSTDAIDEGNQANHQESEETEFVEYKFKYRRRGTGSVHQVSKNVWEGRYSPIVNGKRIARNVYANSVDECEILLDKLIKDMKAEFGIK